MQSKTLKLASFLLVAGVAGAFGLRAARTRTPPPTPKIAIPNGELHSPVMTADPVALLQLGASPESVARLRELVLDEKRPPVVRFAALEHLEQIAPGDAVAAAEPMAVSSGALASVRSHAIALLVRSKAPEAKPALERVTASSAQAAACVADVSRIKLVGPGR
jgi:hypothetical protein